MKEIGIVLSGVEPLTARVLIFNELDIPLWNRLVKIPYGKDAFLVGVITYYQGVNSLYEMPDIARRVSSVMDKSEFVKLLKQKKEYLIADVAIFSAFRRGVKGLTREEISRPVEVGTYVYKLTDEDLSFGRTDYCYLGRFYGEEILQPLYIRDFQTLGEAYHFVVAGQTGSGKSTLVMLLLSLYAKMSAESGNYMNFLILTPVPEFVRAFNSGRTSFGLNLKSLFEHYGYNIEVYSAEDLAFDRWEVLNEFLEEARLFNEVLSIRHHENRSSAIAVMKSYLRHNYSLKDLLDKVDEVIDYMRTDEFIRRVYKDERAQQNLKERLEDEKIVSELRQALSEIFSRFDAKNKKRIEKVLEGFVRSGRGRKGQVLVLDISSEGNRAIQYLVLKEVVGVIRRAGEELYKDDPNLNLNTLIVLEEAHNFVPSRVAQDEEKLRELKERIVRAYAETRKFGIGWMAITTRLSLIDRHVYEHSRVKIIGYGLATGQDRELLREDFGKEFLDRYSSLTDPTDPLNEERIHAFVISGPITILSRREPELMQVFSSYQEFMLRNRISSEELF